MIGMEEGSTAQAPPFFYVGGYVREKQAVIPRVAVAGGYVREKQAVIPGVAVAGGYRGEKRAVIPGVAAGMHRSRTMRGKREPGI